MIATPVCQLAGCVGLFLSLQQGLSLSRAHRREKGFLGGIARESLPSPTRHQLANLVTRHACPLRLPVFAGQLLSSSAPRCSSAPQLLSPCYSSAPATFISRSADTVYKMSRMHTNATSVSKRNHCQKPFPLLIRFLVICLCISYSSAWRSPAARNAVPPALINIRRGCAALLFGSYLLPTSSVFAAADVPSTNGKTTSSIIYKSGKNPRPADPSNPKAGTRKDSTFLKCLSSCKQDCQVRAHWQGVIIPSSCAHPPPKTPYLYLPFFLFPSVNHPRPWLRAPQ